MTEELNPHKKESTITSMTIQQTDYVHELKKQLLLQFESGDKRRVYGCTQCMMGYHSNRIEGGAFTLEQTASLFNTADDLPLQTKDAEEMTGHFMMFNHMLQHIDEPLSEQLIKELHREFASGVFEYLANGYTVGDYKRRANYVSSIVTSLPQNVPADMHSLLNWYNALEKIDLGSVAGFHSRFEHIHPFQDGNGRVGRMILFRECIRNDIPPVIIRSENKARYVQALNADQAADGLVRYMAEEQQAYMEMTIPMLFNCGKAAEPCYKLR